MPLAVNDDELSVEFADNLALTIYQNYRHMSQTGYDFSIAWLPLFQQLHYCVSL